MPKLSLELLRKAMISTTKSFLFIHPPKVAGNSIQDALLPYSDDKKIIKSGQDGIERFGIVNSQYGFCKHSKIKEYKQKLDELTYNSLYRFSILRNPWDRLISYYFSPHRRQQTWNRDDFIRFIETVPSILDYLKDDNDKIDVDFLACFERLQEDFNKVCCRIGIAPKQLANRNRSNRDHYTSYYDNDLVNLVGNKYKEEIELGEYEYGN